MLPRLYQHSEELEPETLRRDSDVVPRNTVRDTAWDHSGWDEVDEDPTVDTNVMLARHGSKSSVHGVVKPRLVPPPFPFPAGLPVAEVRSRMPSLTIVDQPLPIAAPTPPTPQGMVAFRDRFASEIDDPSSEEAPVVHHRSVNAYAATVLAAPSPLRHLGHDAAMQGQPEPQVWPTPEEIHEAFLQHQAFLVASQAMPALTAQTSGVQEIAYVAPRARLGTARILVGWATALVLGAATLAFWRGDVTERDVRITTASAQMVAAHAIQAIRR